MKFRVIDKTSGKKLAGDYVMTENGGPCRYVRRKTGTLIMTRFIHDGVVIQHFTGQLDCDGKEIWEGDTVEWRQRNFNILEENACSRKNKKSKYKCHFSCAKLRCRCALVDIGKVVFRDGEFQVEIIKGMSHWGFYGPESQSRNFSWGDLRVIPRGKK